MKIHEDPTTGEGVVTLDEHELHDVLADMLQNIFRPYLKDQLDAEMPLQVVIEPKNPEYFTPELKQKWEEGLNAFLSTCAGMDATYHDDAEYTC